MRRRVSSGRIRQRRLLPDVALQLHEFLGDLVVVTLRQDTQDRPAGLVHVDAFTERHPARARAFLDDILELHHRDPDESVLPREAIVLCADVQFVKVQLLLLVTDHAVDKGKVENH